MYLRFVWLAVHEESRVPTGLFRAAGRLLDDYDVTPEDFERVEALFQWFNRHLRVPKVTVQARRPWQRAAAGRLLVPALRPRAHRAGVGAGVDP